MTISIIIPVYNEEKSIPKLLSHLLAIENSSYSKEIIIVDGGSQDKTSEVLKAYPQLKIIYSQKGRAIQMNVGAKNASADILYFLHSDTFPPVDFESKIANQVQKGKLSGCFKMKFDYDHPVLKVSQWFTQFNHKSCRGGDQSLFVEKSLFQKLNGFDERLIIYEDNEFIHRLYKNSKFAVIQDSVTTSARKYLKNGVWKLQFNFMMIHLKFWLGADQESLVAYYQKKIK